MRPMDIVQQIGDDEGRATRDIADFFDLDLAQTDGEIAAALGQELSRQRNTGNQNNSRYYDRM